VTAGRAQAASLQGLVLGCLVSGGCALPPAEWADDTRIWQQRATPMRIAVLPSQEAPRIEVSARLDPHVAGAASSAAAAGGVQLLCLAGSLGTMAACITAVMLASQAGGIAAADALRTELKPAPGASSALPAAPQAALADELAAQLRAAAAFRFEAPADVVVSTSLQRIALREESRPWSMTGLYVTAHASMRVVRTRDDFLLAERTYEVTAGRGPPSRYREDPKALVAATAYLLARLAERMTDDLLHGASGYINRPPLLVQPVARPCAGHSSECERNVIIPQLDAAGTGADALVFRWRPAELRPAGGALVYDFRLVGPAAVPTLPLDRPYPLYEHHYIRYGLEAPEHRLQVALAQCASYRWTVRARVIDGAHLQLTPWVEGEMPVVGEETGEPFRTKC
jgi:hypothetical protein